MQNLTDIWTRRLKRLENKTWNGSEPKTGFDFSDGIKSDLLYENDNWNDLAIRDLRELLMDIGMDNAYLKEIWTKTRDDDRTIEISSRVINNQSYFIIELSDYGMYAVSIYKNRGRINCMIDLEYGLPICLEDLTEILYRCGLEDSFEKEKEEEAI